MNISTEVKEPTKSLIKLDRLDTHSGEWKVRVDELRSMLGAPNNPNLFPKHFLKSTFPKIGGEAFTISVDGKPEAAAFLFPRGDGKAKYTARLHISDSGRGKLETAEVFQELQEAGAVVGFEVYYADDTVRTYTETHEHIAGLDIGHPSVDEVKVIRDLQKEAWGSEEDALYPIDIHSEEFNLATSLVARDGGRVIGFLFGFYKLGEDGLRIESQLMAVLPEYRKGGVAFNLKRVQAERAHKEGIRVINWTVDPLQLPNAVLNFGKLRGICNEFFPNYYEFNNALNRVPSSRLQISLLVNTERVLDVDPAPKGGTNILDMSQLGGVAFANDGNTKVDLGIEDCNFLAIEVPEDWTSIQKNDIDAAEKWRGVTDKVLEHYLGEKGKGFAICEVGMMNKNDVHHHYLLAKKMSEIHGI